MIKEIKDDELYSAEPQKKTQKDIGAHWTIKNGEKFYGYNNQTKVYNKSNFTKVSHLS